MTTRTIYPKNQASGGGNDTDTIIAAIAASTRGDVIRMRSVAEGTSTPTAWWLQRPRGNDDVTMVAPSMNFQIYNDMMKGHWSMPPSGPTWASIGVSKGVTFQGDVDGDGLPTTVIKQYTDQPTWDAALVSIWETEVIDPVKFMVSGTEHPKFENLVFKWMSQPIFSIAPFDMINCKFDGSYETIVGYIDDRFVFPHLSADPSNFSDMAVTNIKDCVFRNLIFGIDIWGSGILVEGHDVAENIHGLLYQDQSFTGSMAFFADPYGLNWRFANWKVKPIITMYCRGCILRNGSFDDTDVENCITVAFIAIGDSPGNGICSYNECYGNSFANTSGFDIQLWASYHGRCSNNSVYSNSFNKCQVPFLLEGFEGNADGTIDKPNDNMVTDNTIVDVAHAVQAPLWPEQGPGAALFTTRSNQLVKNDWSLSQLVPLSAATSIFQSGIVMDASDKNTIAESGKWPSGGSPVQYITDINGYSNRIVGGRANAVEKPAGIGQYMRDQIKQAQTKGPRGHHFTRG